jgi:hypothetical protein
MSAIDVELFVLKIFQRIGCCVSEKQRRQADRRETGE